MTKKELVALAKTLGVKGAHDMSKIVLIYRILDAQGNKLEQVDGMNEDDLVSLVVQNQQDAESHPDVELDEDGHPIVEDGDEEASEEEGEQDDDSYLAEEPELTAFDAKAVKSAKGRYPSLAKRDESGKVVRKGTKFNLNVPFREKLYYLPRAAKGAAHDEALAAAPPQVRAIVKHMRDAGVDSPAHSSRGSTIVEGAKAAGLVTSRIESASLFAYYRRVLERVGVVHAVGSGEEEE